MMTRSAFSILLRAAAILCGSFVIGVLVALVFGARVLVGLLFAVTLVVGWRWLWRKMQWEDAKESYMPRTLKEFQARKRATEQAFDKAEFNRDQLRRGKSA
jgi:hypothetical protein